MCWAVLMLRWRLRLLHHLIRPLWRRYRYGSIIIIIIIICFPFWLAYAHTQSVHTNNCRHFGMRAWAKSSKSNISCTKNGTILFVPFGLLAMRSFSTRWRAFGRSKSTAAARHQSFKLFFVMAGNLTFIARILVKRLPSNRDAHFLQTNLLVCIYISLVMYPSRTMFACIMMGERQAARRNSFPSFSRVLSFCLFRLSSTISSNPSK